MIFRRKRKEEVDYYNEDNIEYKEDKEMKKIIGVENLVNDQGNVIENTVAEKEIDDKESDMSSEMSKGEVTTQDTPVFEEFERLVELCVNLALKDKPHKNIYRDVLIAMSMNENKLFRWLKNASYGITNKEIDEEGVKILESLKNAGLVEKVYRVDISGAIEGYSVEELTEKLMDRMHAVYKVKDDFVKKFVTSPPIKINPEDINGIVLKLIELGIAELMLVPKPYYIDKWLDVEIYDEDKSKIIEELKKSLATLPPDLARVIELEK
ncbi:hypothetical protein DRP05_06625 [Archaeoglobales archaeon]|nr:MAG: hypothetical protein DRP05_06625 [Archaeoglobales archaeon]